MPCFHIVLNDDFLFHNYNCHVIVDVCVCVTRLTHLYLFYLYLYIAVSLEFVVNLPKLQFTIRPTVTVQDGSKWSKEALMSETVPIPSYSLAVSIELPTSDRRMDRQTDRGP